MRWPGLPGLNALRIVSVLFILGGCASAPVVEEPRPAPNDARFAPVQPAAPVVEPVRTGSLFNARQANSLYSDVKARRVGDLITVLLTEKTSAKKSATSGADRSISANINTPAIGGLAAIGAGLGADNSFSGSGSANQSNSLSGSISVHVEEVLPNGNLVVRGEKWIKINTGDEYIRLRGIIRPEDVRFDNSVNSSRVANARIEFSGTGQIAQAQTKGWFSRYFTGALWPF